MSSSKVQSSPSRPVPVGSTVGGSVLPASPLAASPLAASTQAASTQAPSTLSSRLGVPAIRDRKGGEPLVMVTAYDAPSARAAAAAGVDLILVGDSLGMVVLGYEDTLRVTIEDMVSHTAAVARTKPPQLVVADMPWTSYHRGTAKAVANAARLVLAGAGAVKLEGGIKRLEVLRSILDAEIPVMGHLGLTPQSVHAMGGFRVQGRRPDEAKLLVEDAIAIAEAGCFAIVLEGIPEGVAAEITQTVPVPTIGIGAGPSCDGQVLVFHDIVGLGGARAPRFARRYADLETLAGQAVAQWASDVRGMRFPSASESYR
jgi:3-methyl-2-oxobutanoate hydroxymethyltransferase